MMNPNQTQKIGITAVDIAIGTAIVLSLMICHAAGLLGLQIQALAACTGAVMCVQDSHKASWKAGMNRILGVICGGTVGIAIVLLDNMIGNELVFYLLCGIGIVANLLLCKVVKLPFVQARVSCMSLLLVVLVLQDGARINYALGRLIGTLTGAVVALVVSMAFAKWMSKKETKKIQ